MQKRLYLYVLIFFTVIFQVFALGSFRGVPDLMLLVVVFSGIFLGPLDGAAAGLVTGFLRGCFSIGTHGVDLVVFPLIGYVSSVLSVFFYRRNPSFQILASAAGIFLLVFFHVAYFNASGGGLSMTSVFLRSWKHVVLTVMISPFIFTILFTILKLEE